MEIKVQNLHNQAVDAALNKDWEKAIELNLQALDIDPLFVDAMLALGYAYMQLGDYKNAKKYYKEALKHDPINVIARNNVDKISILEKKGSKKKKSNTSTVSPETFINIKGKTRVISLANIGQADVLADLETGEVVELTIKKRRIEVRNSTGEYIGCLPDDISKRMMFFIEAKSKYKAIIKASTKNTVDIFVKELKRGAKVKNFVSFPDNIQDDMKRIIGKAGEDEEDVQTIDVTGSDEDDEEDSVEDLEALALKAEEDAQKDDDLIDIETDDEEEEE